MFDQANETLDQVTFTVKVTVLISLLLPVRARRNDWNRFDGIDQLQEFISVGDILDANVTSAMHYSRTRCDLPLSKLLGWHCVQVAPLAPIIQVFVSNKEVPFSQSTGDPPRHSRSPSSVSRCMRCRKRYDSPANSKMCALCVSRSNKAAVRHSSPKTCAQSAKRRFVVIMWNPLKRQIQYCL